jgi:hypothetical protein
MKIFMLLFLCVGIAGCATTGVIPMDKDTYMIARRSAQVGFGPPLGAKAEVYKQANAFCEKQDKTVETVDFNMINSGFARPGSVNLQFRCISGSSLK